MKLKISFLLLSTLLLCFSCSSDDDSNEKDTDKNLTNGHFSLRVNGANYDNERVELFRDTINNYTYGRTIFSSSDDFGNGMFILMDHAFEEGTYTIQPYGEQTPNIVAFRANTNELFKSNSGSITFEEIITDFNTGCQNFKGIYNFDLTGEANNTPLNIVGEFDVTYYGCEE